MTKLIKKVFTVSVVVTTIFWAIGLAALLPMGAGAAALDGDLIKKDGLPSLYYFYGGKRYVFPNEATYFSWYSDFSGVKTIDASELESYLLGGNVVMRPGTKLAKITTDPKVYAVEPNGVLRHIDSEARATTLYGANWAQRVVDVPDAFFTNYTIGTALASNVHPAGSLVKYASGATMYYMADGGLKRAFASQDAFTANRYKLSDVLTISDTLTYSDGAAITGAEMNLTNTAQQPIGPVTTGALTLSLASETPAAGSVPYCAANTVMTYVNLTAGADAATLTSLKVTRVGLGADANLGSVKLYKDGIQLGTSQNLNSAHQAAFNNINLAIPANSTVKLGLAADIADVTGGTLCTPTGAVSGHQVGLAINAASDLTTTASVGGTFPIMGNVMTISSVGIGAAQLYNGTLNPSSDTGIDPNAVDARLTQIKITASGAEGVKITQLTAIKNGTAAASDIKDIKLVNDTAGTTLATVASLDGNGKAVFSGLNVDIAKGQSIELSILASLTGSGSGRTVAFDLHDGVAYTIMAKGLTYGYGLTPTRNNFCAAAGTCQTQTINQGTLQVNKSSSTPATGYIAQGGTQAALVAYDFVVTGEPINVTNQIYSVTFGTMTYDQLTNVTMYDPNGLIVAGPVDTSSGNTVTFTDSVQVPVGTTTYTIKADVSTGTSALDTAQIKLNTPATKLTVKGANSGKTVTSTTASTVDGNVQTVQGPALAISTATIPVVGTMVTNGMDQSFAYFDFDATNGGEDIKITQLIVTDTLGGAAAYADLANLELWGDPDNTDATAENVMLQTSTSTSTNANTVTFTFKSPLKVSKSNVSRLTLKADVVGNAGSGSHAYNIASDNVTAVGWSTGQTPSKSYSGNGQAQTLADNGILKVNRASDYPAASQLVAASTGNLLMKYKFEASYEPIDVSQITVYLNGTVADFANVKLYDGATQIGSTLNLNADKYATFVLNPGTFVVPRDGYKVLSIKADLSAKANLNSGDSIVIGISDSTTPAASYNGGNEWGGVGNYYIVATGASSGQTIAKANIDSVGDGSGSVYGSNTFYAYDGVLTVALASGSPSGVKTPGTGNSVLCLTLTATGADVDVEDIEFVRSGTSTITGTGVMYLYGTTNGGTTCTADTSVKYVHWATGTAWLNASDFNATADATSLFGSTAATSNLQVAEGTSLNVVLVGDTTGGASDKTLQVAVSAPAAGNSTTAGLEWRDAELVSESGSNVDSALTKNLPVTGGTISF
ncbi:MAG: hypothetical protein WC480_02340 [Patescibacteria group bacterium]